MARQLATVVAFGLASATAIYLGKTIGEKKYEHAKAYARRFVWLSVLMGVLGGILILAIAPFYGGGDDIVRDCQMVHAVYVFCYVLFCSRTGI